MQEGSVLRSYGAMFRQYAVFRGRTDRADYWRAMTVHSILLILLVIVAAVSMDEGFFHLLQLYRLATLVPAYALSARRLHDIGRSGWWSLTAASGVGAVVLMIWLARVGEPDENLFGADPHPVSRY